MIVQRAGRFIAHLFQARAPGLPSATNLPPVFPPEPRPHWTFTAARQANPVFSKMAATPPGSSPFRSVPAASFTAHFDAHFSGTPNAGAYPRDSRDSRTYGRFPSRYPDTWTDARWRPAPMQQPAENRARPTGKSANAGTFDYMMARAMAWAPEMSLPAISEQVVAHIDSMLEQMFRDATQAYLRMSAQMAAARPPLVPRMPRNRQRPQATPQHWQQQPYHPRPANARSAQASPMAMPIATSRDSAGWASYVQQLRQVHGWTDVQVTQWVADFKDYIKFGNEKAATAFNAKYAGIMQAQVEDSDMRANFTQLMKAMSKSLKPAA